MCDNERVTIEFLFLFLFVGKVELVRLTYLRVRKEQRPHHTGKSGFEYLHVCACNGMTVNSHQRASVLIVIERVPFGGIGGVCVTNDVLLFGFTYSGDFTFPFATGWNRRRSR